MIDPDIWTSEKFVALSHGARLLFIGMFSHADDYGRVKVDPLWLKLKVFPADESTPRQIVAWRGEIENQHDMLKLYEADGGIYGWLPGFKKVQTKLTQFAPKYPPPPDHFGADLHGSEHQNGPSEGHSVTSNGPAMDHRRAIEMASVASINKNGNLEAYGPSMDHKGTCNVPNDVDVDGVDVGVGEKHVPEGGSSTNSGVAADPEDFPPVDRFFKLFNTLTVRPPISAAQRAQKEVPSIREDTEALIRRLGWDRAENALRWAVEKHKKDNDPLGSVKAAVAVIAKTVREDAEKQGVDDNRPPPVKSQAPAEWVAKVKAGQAKKAGGGA